MSGWLGGRRGAGRGTIVALALALAAAVGACGEGAEPGESAGSAGSEEWKPLVRFDTIAVAIETDTATIRISAELADNDDRRQYGLMERPELAEDHGMLFIYGEEVEPGGSFWMYRTRVALDIAFLDEDGRIVARMAMDPCTSPNPQHCRQYSPGVAYTGALEVKQGFLDRHGVEVGDRVRVVDEDGGAAAGP